MERKTREWLAFLGTRLVGAGVDTLIMLAAYVLAFAVRLEFREPAFGWRAACISFVFTWIVQMASLLATGCYRIHWRRIRALDLPHYLGATLLSCVVLTLLRVVFADGGHAWLRPPYSVTLMNTVLFGVGVVLARVTWSYYQAARQREHSLLDRPERLANAAVVVDLFRNKTVLVTGAGGSIGSELVRQVAEAGPARVLMVERSELALYQIDREMRTLGTNTPCVPLMLDITDDARMQALFDKWEPDIVLHAAAYKHVPLVESNPREGLFNNTFATRRLGEIAASSGVKRFVMISTDKAVNPVSVMGITKRLAEVLLLDLSSSPIEQSNNPNNPPIPQSNNPNNPPIEQSNNPNNPNNRTIFSAVRFGNVLGSSGSVVPLFREQIAKRGPVTVTHPDMKRYFMTIPEAVSLVLQAAALAQGGEIFTLDMGEPVRVLDLAEKMIHEAGFRPYVDIPIVFTGIRPGEKLFEELDISEKNAFKTGHARIYICKSRPVDVARVMGDVKAVLTSEGEVSKEMLDLLRQEAQ